MFFKYIKGDFNYTGDGFPCGLQTNKILISEIYNSYLDSYGKTVVVEEECDCAEGKQPSKIYYTKNVGIVRKELLDSNQVWNLVNYHIEE